MWLVFCLLYVLATAMVAVVLPAHKKEEREDPSPGVPILALAVVDAASI